MPHIHTNPGQHDLTVTAFIVRTDTSEPQVLLHMHKKLKVLLPVGGHVELNETPWQAIAHELEEESGYKLEQLDVLQPKSRIRSLKSVDLHPYPLAINTHPIPDNHFHTDIEYAFVAHGDPSGIIGEGESADMRWVTRAELETLDGMDVVIDTKQAYLFILDEALNEWEHIPAKLQLDL